VCPVGGAEPLSGTVRKPVVGGGGGDMTRHLSLRRLDFRQEQSRTGLGPGQLGPAELFSP
jgi:hypothetical protein